MTGKSPTRKPVKTLGRKRLLLLKPWLDELNDQIEQSDYITHDPVSFLHAYDQREDQLLAGFFAAIMAWGRRDIVLSKVSNLLERMDHRPEAYIRNFDDNLAASLSGFKHRTFTEADVYWLIRCLRQAILRHGSFEGFWAHCYRTSGGNGPALMDHFHDAFFDLEPGTPRRTRKHIASRKKNSSCKRLWLYLRWTIRKNSVVDLGIMDFMPASELHIPLDVHVARQARRIGLLGRPQNDWKAVAELQERLKMLNPSDPARYDYALFGIGVLKLPVPEEYIINKRVE